MQLQETLSLISLAEAPLLLAEADMGTEVASSTALILESERLNLVRAYSGAVCPYPSQRANESPSLGSPSSSSSGTIELLFMATGRV
jgi:hypothetical protein